MEIGAENRRKFFCPPIPKKNILHKYSKKSARTAFFLCKKMIFIDLPTHKAVWVEWEVCRGASQVNKKLSRGIAKWD
jgi:hypothetical protein